MHFGVGLTFLVAWDSPLAKIGFIEVTPAGGARNDESVARFGRGHHAPCCAYSSRRRLHARVGFIAAAVGAHQLLDRRATRSNDYHRDDASPEMRSESRRAERSDIRKA